MFNNKVIIKIKPLIFKKKFDYVKTIFINQVNNTLGPVRYYPPANQEWFNSIYAYNNKYTKNITIADKNLSKLIKSYFNLYLDKKLLYNKRIIARFKRLKINKIFISKAELKHTTSKVIVTLYVYNEERRILLNRLKRIESMLFPSNIYTYIGYKEKIFSLYQKLDIIKKEKENLSLKDWLEESKKDVIERINTGNKVLANLNTLKLRDQKLLEISSLKNSLKELLILITVCEDDPISQKIKIFKNKYNNFINKIVMDKEISIITYFKLLLSLNKSKFEDTLVLKLKPLIKKIYNKEVELNIVNLKAIYLNSDIFTQAISLKLQNRNNRLLNILRYFLHMVKLSKINFLKERFSYINNKDLWVNKVKNLTFKSLYPNVVKDSVNQLLISIFTNSNFSNKLERNKSCYKTGIDLNFDLLKYIFNALKYKSIAGIRLEAKGRLTRRFTASRSVFKIKWKGSLKNIDSSYKGLSSVILRGYIKSNVQYSKINSKTRNGAFGIKGWVSGK
jgi:Mitochondrial ribosomal protein (VAR1)